MAGRKTVLITGATSGIGLALIRQLALNHTVIAAGRMSPEDAAEIVPEIVRYVQCDQRQPFAAAPMLVDDLARLGIRELDHAVLNAGAGRVATGELESAAIIRETLDVNLGFAIAAAHALFPLLEPRRGLLTLVGSVAASGSSGFPAYAASKAGLNGFGRSLRAEWRGRVDVQVVHPAATQTPMHAKAGYDAGWVQNLFLSADDMAKMLHGAMAWRKSPVRLDWLRYFGGGAYSRRRL